MSRVEHILEDARRRLAVIERHTPLRVAAGILANSTTPLIVVCDSQGVALGVVSSRDVLIAYGRAEHDASAGAVMTTDIHSCDLQESLESLWSKMGKLGLRSIPVLDASGKPVGIAHARDIARELIDEVTHEELLLRDYVLGVGYR